MKLTNKSKRSLGIPCGSVLFVLDSGKHRDITEKELQKIASNKMAARWLESGVLVVEVPTNQDEPHTKPVETIVDDPKSNTIEENHPNDEPDKAIFKHVGAGRWNAFVNGEPLSDKPLDKAEAEELAGEYNADR